MANYDHIDADFTWDGDYFIGSDGDLADTQDDTIRSLLNEVRTVIRCEVGDWELHSMIGANLADFLGEPNTSASAKAIEERVVSSLVSAGLVQSSDVKVRVVPVQNHIVLIMIAISAEATYRNSLAAGEPAVVSFTYDSMEDSVFFLPPSEVERLGR